jgi:crossover junction endodeoxyribonuclease RuvC
VIILGLDPGTRHTGWAVVDCAGAADRAVAHGVIDLAGSLEHPERLRAIYDAVRELIDEHGPVEAAVEMPVFSGNAQSLLKLGRAQAALMLAAIHASLPISQYTPAEVKKSVVGNGNAAKEQVAYMVRTLLQLPDTPAADAADAFAVALCHARRGGTITPTSTGARGWKSFVEANPGRVRGRG